MRLLLATDQPFWRCQGGAHQRILSLWSALQRPLPTPPSMESPTESRTEQATTDAWERCVFYVGNPAHLPSEAEQANNDFGTLISARSGPAPGPARPSLWTRLSVSVLGRPPAHSTSTRSNLSTSLRLSDYSWSWVLPHFRKTVAKFRPDVVILEYVTMTYLIQAIPEKQRRKIIWAVDTHDRLAERNRQFQALGQAHWLDISEEEERTALAPADLIIAIESEEAQWFRQHLPDSHVVVAGHAPCPPKPRTTVSPQPTGPSSLPVNIDARTLGNSNNSSTAQTVPGPLRLGFIASNNFPNRDALSHFFTHVITALPTLNVQWIIAGSICDWLHAPKFQATHPEATRLAETHRLITLGTVSNLEDFYSQIDGVISPIRIGTGLKIKTIEALAYHRPVLATPHAAGALGQALPGIFVCATTNDWIQTIQGFAEHPEQLIECQAQLRSIASSHLSPAAVYHELHQTLETMRAQRGSAT